MHLIMTRRTFFWAAFIAQTALALLLCTIPLFDLLGYEFSFVIGSAAVFTGQLVGLGFSCNGRRGLWQAARLFALASAHLLGALVVISVNMLWVRNCDYIEGLEFFLLLPVVGAVLAATLGFLWRVRLSTWRVRALATMLLPACIVLWHLWRLYSYPPIFVYDHLFGFFAGSLYDEGIKPTGTLLIFRMVSVLWAIVVWLFCWSKVSAPSGFGPTASTSKTPADASSFNTSNTELLAQTRRFESVRGALRPLHVRLLAFLLVAMLDLVLGARLPYRVNTDIVDAELSVEVRRPGLVIHLPSGTNQKMQAAVAADHEFRLVQLCQRLGIDTRVFLQRPIHSYIYRNAQHKARFMGGQNTMIAKPWLRQIHVHGVVAEHGVMPHELVHVLAAQFAAAPFFVSAHPVSWGGRYFGSLSINMGLVEGLAEAYAPQRGELDLHTYARGLHDLGTMPAIERILSAEGFWQVAPGRAYTAVGSFVRYLGDTYGTDALKEVYADGNFQRAYHRSLKSLVDEWLGFIDGLDVMPRDIREAAARFAEKSIFKRPCAHVIAQLRRSARGASKLEALRIQERICAHLGRSVVAQANLAMAYARAGKKSEFMERAHNLLKRDDLPERQRYRLLEKRAEISWARNDLDQARVGFQAVFQAQLSLASERLQWVRLWALGAVGSAPDSTEVTELLQERVHHLLSGRKASKSTLVMLEDLRHRLPQDKTIPYLLGRQLLNENAELAETYLTWAAGHAYIPIEAERVRLLARLKSRQNKNAEALYLWKQYRELVPRSGERARADDMVQRLYYRLHGTVLKPVKAAVDEPGRAPLP